MSLRVAGLVAKHPPVVEVLPSIVLICKPYEVWVLETLDMDTSNVHGHVELAGVVPECGEMQHIL